MTENERREAEIRSIMKSVTAENPEKAEKKPEKKEKAPEAEPKKPAKKGTKK